MEILIYLAIFTVPMAAHVLSLRLGANIFDFANFSFEVTLFRGFILLALVWYSYQYLRKLKRSKIRTCYKPLKAKTENAFSRSFLLAWLGYAMFTVVWANSYGAWFRQVYFIGIGVLLVWLFGKFLNDKEKLYKAILALQLGILVQALIGGYEVLTRNYHWLEMTQKNIWTYVEGENRIPIAMQGNPNNYASLMLVGVALALISLFKQKELRKKIAFGAMAVGEAALIVCTTSRANILALGIMAFIVILCTKNKWIILATLVGGALLIAFPFRGYLLSVMNFNFGQSGSSDNVRINLIKNGFIFLGKSLGLGVGAGQTEYWMANDAVYDVRIFTNMHNFWMEILVNYGVLLFLFFVVFYFRLIWKFAKAAKKLPTNDPQRWTYVSIVAVMVSFIVAAISASSILSVEWLWFCLALLVTYQGVLGKYPQTGVTSVYYGLHESERLRWHDYFGIENYVKRSMDKISK